MITNRFQAFGIHLLGSLLIALTVAFFVFFIWYERPLHVASGVTDIFLLLISVDIVIGPLITLVVFNIKKKELKRDLLVVLLLQMIALSYGAYTVFVARPVYIVFNADRFDLVFANDINREELSKVVDPEFKTLPNFGTKIISAVPPENKEEKNRILFNSVLGGIDVQQMPRYYRPYASEIKSVQKRIRPLEELKKYNRQRLSAVNNLFSKYLLKSNEFGYLPLKGRTNDLCVIVRRSNAEIMEIVNLQPWD